MGPLGIPEILVLLVMLVIYVIIVPLVLSVALRIFMYFAEVCRVPRLSADLQRLPQRLFAHREHQTNKDKLGQHHLISSWKGIETHAGRRRSGEDRGI